VTHTIVAPVLHRTLTDIMLEEVELDAPRRGDLLDRLMTIPDWSKCTSPESSAWMS